jgi:O-acetyl-ADP-ribose deacetylase (regulator of RNase III)
MFKAYAKACKDGDVQIGRMFVYDLGGLIGKPRWIINFPTKVHWRSNSCIADIDAGLNDLLKTIRELDIRSIAIPALGCGNGGLEWRDVRPRIEAALSPLTDVHIMLFPPPNPSPTHELAQTAFQIDTD